MQLASQLHVNLVIKVHLNVWVIEQKADVTYNMLKCEVIASQFGIDIIPIAFDGMNFGLQHRKRICCIMAYFKSF